MRNFVQLLSICLVFTGIFSCSKQKANDPPGDPVQINLSQHQKDLVISNNSFGFNIFKSIINNEDHQKNVFVSPLSISLALAMTYNGANGDTRTEMQNTLQFPDLSSDEINTYFQTLSNALIHVDSRVNLGIANSIWYRNGFTILPSFLEVNQDYYDAEVKSLDFSNPSSVNTINNWVSDQTNKRITKVISGIDSDLVMFLINAIYFKGSWSQEFEKNGTHDLTFNLTADELIQTPMMHQKGSFNYFSNAKFSVVEMPYGQGNFTMVVLLPNEGFTTQDIITDLSSSNWDSWMNNLTKVHVDITFPRFKFEYERFLNNELASLGMVKAFSTIDADFTLINPNGGLFISYVKHNSFVEVNETGTEAAAVTTVAVGNTMAGPEPVYISFLANKPFLFAIRETTTNTILFMGRLNNPQ